MGCDFLLASMTGFGRVHKHFGDYSITVEMKSVNHRFCEINVRLPRQMMILEETIKKRINNHINRGRVEVFINIEGNKLISKTLKVDWKLLDEYYQALLSSKERYKIEDPVTLQLLLNQSDIVEVVEKEELAETFEENLVEMIDIAIKKLIAMRYEEGSKLLEDINANLTYIEESCKEISAYAPVVIEQYRVRLQKKIEELTEGLIDESRLITEVTIFSDKVDINEEITRINSHINQFHKTLQGTEEVVGRKLDFLVQELNREINTIGSKANNADIAHYVVNMKTKLEKIKEQVQNIE